MYRLLAIILVCLASGCGAIDNGGQRLIEARVEKDGVYILQSQYPVAEDASESTVWTQLGGCQLKQLVSLAEGQSSTVLTGKIEIVLRHAGAAVVRGEIQQLHMTRVPGTVDYWTIPKEEIERTKKAAGL